MLPLLLLSALSFNMIEVGAGMGINVPIGNMERYFSAGALISIHLGKEIGPGKFILSFDNSTLSGNGQPTYELQMNRIGLEYGYYVIRGGNWSLPLSLGINHIWLSREFQTLEEKGTVQGAEIGIGFLEKIKRTSLGAKFFVSGLYSLSKIKSSAYMVGLKATIGYDLKKEKPIVPPVVAAEVPKVEKPAEPVLPLLATIYFDFDHSDIRPTDAEILEKNAKQLRNCPDVRVTIEGHCCPIGTSEYNMALGWRRANSAQDYLMKLGIDKDRISTISYGEEKPVSTIKVEYWKNRRCEFKTK